jgi:hypothetical protein
MHLACDPVVEDFQCPVSPESLLSTGIQILGETRYHAVHMAGGCRVPIGTGNTLLLLERLSLSSGLSDVGRARWGHDVMKSLTVTAQKDRIHPSNSSGPQDGCLEESSTETKGWVMLCLHPASSQI